MNNSQGALFFDAGINMNQWRNNVNEMRRDILGISNTTTQQTRQMDSSFKNLSTAVAGYFSASMLGGFIQQVVNIRGEFQKTEIAFGTMLRSQSAAKDLMAQMVDLAATTPFSLQDVSNGAKQLLAFQIPANEVVDVLTRMGNIAAGLGVPLSRINLVYGQVKAKGKLMGDDLRQFTEAGIPMVAELAKKFNTSTAEITKMVSAGKIGFKDVQDVLFSLTNEGGMFFNLMEKQSKSLSGQISNLGDSWDQMLNKIGEGNEGILSDGISAMNYLVKNYETVIEVVGVMVASYGVYRAALIATVTWQKLSSLASYQQALSQGVLTRSQALGTAAAILLRNAHASLNATLVANPIGLVIGLIAGLSYVIYKNITATTAYTDLQQKLTDSTKKHSESLNEQRSKIESLVAVIKNKNTTDEVAKKALNQINTITGNRIKGLTVEGIRLGQNTSLLGGYIKMLEKEARARALMDTILAAEKKEKDILSDPYSKLSWGDEFGNYRDAGDILKDPFTRKREAQIEDLTGLWKVKTDAQKEFNKLAQEGVDISAPITKGLESAEEEVKKKKEAHKRELAEIFSKGSIADLEQRISLWNEALQKASGKNVQELTKNKFGDTIKTGKTFKLEDAKDELEELEKAKAQRIKEIQRLSFEEQIAETKRQIEVRDKLLKSGYSKESVDKMFPEVKDKSFIQYLNDTSSVLEKLEGKESAENLIKIQQVLTEYKGEATFIENVNKQIDELKSKFSGNELIDKLEKFKKANVDGTTGDEKNAKNIAIEKAQEAELERQKQLYNDFLKEKETFEQKKKAIDDKYNSIDAAINGSDSSADEKARLLAESGKERGREYSEAFIDGIASSEMWQKAFGEIGDMTNSEIRKSIKFLQDQLKKLAEGGDADPNKIKSISDQIKSLQGVLNENPFEKIKNDFKKMTDTFNDPSSSIEKKLVAIQAIFNSLGEGVQMVGDAFGGFDEQTQDTVNSIMEIGNAAFDMAKSIATGDVAGMISAGLKLIGSIGKALNGDKKREREIKKQAKALEELERVYESLGRAIEKSLGEKFFNASKNAIANLKQQKALIEQMMRTESQKKKTDQDKLNAFRDQIISINNSIEDMHQSMIDKILNGLNAKGLADQLSDALTTAFQNGEDSAEAMSKTVDRIFADMVKNALKMKLLEGPMQSVVDKMLQSMGFSQVNNSAQINTVQQQITALQQQYDAIGGGVINMIEKIRLKQQIDALKAQLSALINGQSVDGSFDGLTEAERAELKAMIEAAGLNYTNALQEYESLFEGIGENATGLKGDIKGITEKTAGALEAQINAIRIYQVEAINIHRSNQAVFMNSLNNLIAIEFNTRRLHSIDDGIQTLISKSKGLAGIP